jgi:hypothetical protein
LAAIIVRDSVAPWGRAALLALSCRHSGVGMHDFLQAAENGVQTQPSSRNMAVLTWQWARWWETQWSARLWWETQSAEAPVAAMAEADSEEDSEEEEADRCRNRSFGWCRPFHL